MQRPEFRELAMFAEVARQLNFTRAAAALNVSLASISQTLKGLEEKLGVRLLARTTKSVSLTEAGNQLLAELGPVFQGLETALDGLTRFRKSPGGRLRIVVSRTAATLIVGPLIGQFMATYPDIELEMLVDDLHLDLVSNRIDAGVQLGDRIEKDMITQRLVGPFGEFLFASPQYVAQRRTPQAPEDLCNHRCVRLRSSYDGTIRPWILHRQDQKAAPAIGMHFVANDLRVLATAVEHGAGIGLLPRVLVHEQVQRGTMVPILADWCSPITGIYLFYPSRRQNPAPLDAFLSFMRENKLPARWDAIERSGRDAQSPSTA
ncbi:LysR family transcriptional regulator [Bradyrhizobium jicamae]|uniref:LysR family transcriptional regulator n=1 Tax=Bradyrhizobium jicamae TaxID=280332 RepID=UPI001BA7EE24|nr:LysR family transcriptional regulator [Bradyrhizobium jicamae]MBR0751253.1 LysR family transcriptional regulator [Bradyrhizobium jicamae]